MSQLLLTYTRKEIPIVTDVLKYKLFTYFTLKELVKILFTNKRWYKIILPLINNHPNNFHNAVWEGPKTKYGSYFLLPCNPFILLDNYRDCIFSGASLIRVNLEGANLTYADLSEANLTYATITHADLHKANLHKANLEGANLHYANLEGANLTEANLKGANMSNATLDRINLSNVDLSNTNLSHVHMTNANLSGANLQGANLSGANLQGANLSGANLQGVDLFATNLRLVDLTGITHINVDVSWTYIRGAITDNLDFHENNPETIFVKK